MCTAQHALHQPQRKPNPGAGGVLPARGGLRTLATKKRLIGGAKGQREEIHGTCTTTPLSVHRQLLLQVFLAI